MATSSILSVFVSSYTSCEMRCSREKPDWWHDRSFCCRRLVTLGERLVTWHLLRASPSYIDLFRQSSPSRPALISRCSHTKGPAAIRKEDNCRTRKAVQGEITGLKRDTRLRVRGGCGNCRSNSRLPTDSDTAAAAAATASRLRPRDESLWPTRRELRLQRTTERSCPGG